MTTTPGDPHRAGDFLMVDVYPFDLGEHPPWERLRDAQAPAGKFYVGAMIKISDGVKWGYEPWVLANWPAIVAAAPARYGIDWFRAGYHYLQFSQDGMAQADYYLRTIERAGMWGPGDFLPVVDVERPENSQNAKASKAQVEACVSAFTYRIKAELGRDCLLYGRGAMRDLSITSRMGCSALWNPSYTEHPVSAASVGWPLQDVAWWQYGGDGQGAAKDLPLTVPGFGAVDLSVYIDGTNATTLDSLRRRCIGYAESPAH